MRKMKITLKSSRPLKKWHRKKKKKEKKLQKNFINMVLRSRLLFCLAFWSQKHTSTKLLKHTLQSFPHNIDFYFSTPSSKFPSYFRSQSNIFLRADIFRTLDAIIVAIIFFQYFFSTIEKYFNFCHKISRILSTTPNYFHYFFLRGNPNLSYSIKEKLI